MNSSRRILDQLEHGRTTPLVLSTQSSRRHLAYALGVAVVVALLAAGVVAWGPELASHPAAGHDPAHRSAATVASNVADKAVRKEADMAAGSRPQEEHRLAAAIVNEPLQQHADGLARSNARADNAGAVRDAGIVQGARAAGPNAVPGTQGTARTGAQADAARAAGAPRHVRPAATATMATTAGTATQRQQANKDSDITLLSALVAHVNRDVGNDLTTQLQQCAQLSGNQATACHARACTGRWGRDSACRITPSE